MRLRFKGGVLHAYASGDPTVPVFRVPGEEHDVPDEQAQELLRAFAGLFEAVGRPATARPRRSKARRAAPKAPPADKAMVSPEPPAEG